MPNLNQKTSQLINYSFQMVTAGIRNIIHSALT